MKTKLAMLLTVSTLLCASFGAAAASGGGYSVTYYGDGKPADLAGLISDLVTPEYATRFPAERYEIVLIYHCTPTPGGAETVCTSTAGVSPKIKVQGRTGGLVPDERFNTAAVQPKGASTSDIDATRNTVIRASISALMSDLPEAPKPRAAGSRR